MTTHQNTFPNASIISVNGVELEVFEAGRENAGNPIVLCHGWPDLAYTWRFQIPALVAAGYHVIAPNQRGFGGSANPEEIVDYDISKLTGDLAALLDHFGYTSATFMGHDWGTFIVWSFTLLYPKRVDRVVALSLPYLARGEMPWLDFMEAVLGEDYYFVHFNKQPGVADAVFDADPARFLNNLYRRDEPLLPPKPGMAMIEIAKNSDPLGQPLLTEQELAVYSSAFTRSGFTGGINWYRNLNRNWHLLADADPIIQQPALMIYGLRDAVARSEQLSDFVPKVEEMSFDSGHWVHQERHSEVTPAIIEWLTQTPSA
ncbi:alpha/beta hydrolase [Leucobacter sp. UT-8R-CII-1-4]|uniref:alpha/beta fold hydrolase n=1 Tax=Leucobacter sp. UT-8R-CII-1-4 TaxID=3040075 RepID=UPI0024A7ACA9|nr:alpha/beta hydrolase [Leucobacter sp. UT-8R-CII-1-4]MDI6022681.1 alpha/beta hydrolase [Leucobacter sp. UT-8R-CII-1-4]